MPTLWSAPLAEAKVHATQQRWFRAPQGAKSRYLTGEGGRGPTWWIGEWSTAPPSSYQYILHQRFCPRDRVIQAIVSLDQWYWVRGHQC